MESEDGRICANEEAEGKDRNRRLAGLYRVHRRELHQFLLGLLRDRAEADEALQQVFLKLLESWQTVQLTTAKGWLYTVAYHEALARRRRRQVHEMALDRLWAQPVWQCGAEHEDPAHEFVRADRQEAVRRAVRELPDVQRDVVERRVYRNQTFAAIAQEINCPLNTVLSRMRLALGKLKRVLEDMA